MGMDPPPDLTLRCARVELWPKRIVRADDCLELDYLDTGTRYEIRKARDA